jgi:predicted small metal-binding protein
MMKLTCKELNPSTTCTYEATGDTAREVADKMMTHVKIVHPEDIKNMPEADMKKTMEARAHY